jgi:hypothetical protein
VKKRALVILAMAAVAAAIPVADALRVAPLAKRNGVVVTWRAQNKVAVIAQPSGKLLAIHAIRRVTPGTRVTVSGIKWGSPVAGIKWSTAPSGIKWGIKWGRNGSYSSGIRRSTKKAVWTPIRGPIVKKFGKKAVAVGTPGGVVVVRIAALRRGSEGLAGQKELMAGGLPPVGATISVRVFFGKNGIKIGRNLRYLKPPVPGASLPFAGTIESINVAAKTMVVVDKQDRAYPVRITVALPPEFTIAPYTPGTEVAVSGRFTPNGVMSATLISENGNFSEADDPSTTQILTTGQPACTQAREAACPQTSPGDTASVGSGAQPGGGSPVLPSSPSPPTLPSPPSGGKGTSPGGDPPPAPGDPDPDTDPDPDDGPAPPSGCDPTTGRSTRGHLLRHRPPRCWVAWCRAQRRETERWPGICRKNRDRRDHNINFKRVR